MLTQSSIASLTELPPPVLSIYLDTNAAKPGGMASGGARPPHLARFQSHLRLLAAPGGKDQKCLREQAERAKAFLNQLFACRGVILFVGPSVWQEVRLQVPVQDEIHWGAPALAQLFWLLDEYRPYGLVLAARKAARFLLSRFNEIVELDPVAFSPGESRRKEMGPVSRPGVKMSHGINRDAFQHHREARYRHFYGQVAGRIERWAKAERLDRIFLAGLHRTVREICDQLPGSLRNAVVPVEEDFGWMSSAELQSKILQLVESHERRREMELVQQLFDGEPGVTRGVDQTLAQLQQGRLRRIVIDRSFHGHARQCLRCGHIDRTADPLCPSCGGERQAAALRSVLPLLTRRQAVPVEIVSGEAAQALQKWEGIGGWLRELEKKEYTSG